MVAVGQLQIDHTPARLKNFAISEFGSDDKLALVIGIFVVLAIIAAVIGAGKLGQFDGTPAGHRSGSICGGGVGCGVCVALQEARMRRA